jgi:hypothetical protein
LERMQTKQIMRLVSIKIEYSPSCASRPSFDMFPPLDDSERLQTDQIIRCTLFFLLYFSDLDAHTSACSHHRTSNSLQRKMPSHSVLLLDFSNFENGFRANIAGGNLGRRIGRSFCHPYHSLDQESGWRTSDFEGKAAVRQGPQLDRQR